MKGQVKKLSEIVISDYIKNPKPPSLSAIILRGEEVKYARYNDPDKLIITLSYYEVISKILIGAPLRWCYLIIPPVVKGSPA